MEIHGVLCYNDICIRISARTCDREYGSDAYAVRKHE